MAIYDQDTRTVPKPPDRARLTLAPDYTTNNMGGPVSMPQTTDINQTGAGSNPFDYTAGSLLTPWTKTFNYTPAAPAPAAAGGGEPAAPAGPAAPPPPGWQFGELNYSFRNPGDFTARPDFTPEAAFVGARQAGPATFAAPADFRAERYVPGLNEYKPGQVAAPNVAMGRFTPQSPFTPPMLTEDPGYQFRVDQGRRALEASAAARGTLRGGATLQALTDYGQSAASQEYANAYARRFGEWQSANELGLAAFDRNTSAAALENETALEYFNANEQARQYGEASGRQDRQFGADFNYRSGLTENDLAYQRRADEYKTQQALSRQTEETNYAREASEYDRRTGNARDVYAMNAKNALDAYQATSATNAAMGNLGWQVASGSWDRNFQNAQFAFQTEENRRMAAMAAAAGGGGGGGGGGTPSESQQYNRALQQYQMEYEIFNANQQNQYNRLMGLAGLGITGAGQSAGYAGQYGANVGGNYIGAGNAAAAGQVGAANAWNAGLTGLSNAGMMAAIPRPSQPSQSQWYDPGMGS